MSLSEQTVKCPICGEPYKVYAFSAADQSACPSCVAKAERKDKDRWGKELFIKHEITFFTGLMFFCSACLALMMKLGIILRIRDIFCLLIIGTCLMYLGRGIFDYEPSNTDDNSVAYNCNSGNSNGMDNDKGVG